MRYVRSSPKRISCSTLSRRSASFIWRLLSLGWYLCSCRLPTTISGALRRPPAVPGLRPRQRRKRERVDRFMSLLEDDPRSTRSHYSIEAILLKGYEKVAGGKELREQRGRRKRRGRTALRRAHGRAAPATRSAHHGLLHWRCAGGEESRV